MRKSSKNEDSINFQGNNYIIYTDDLSSLETAIQTTPLITINEDLERCYDQNVAKGCKTFEELVKPAIEQTISKKLGHGEVIYTGRYRQTKMPVIIMRERTFYEIVDGLQALIPSLQNGKDPLSMAFYEIGRRVGITMAMDSMYTVKRNNRVPDKAKDATATLNEIDKVAGWGEFNTHGFVPALDDLGSDNPSSNFTITIKRSFMLESTKKYGDPNHRLCSYFEGYFKTALDLLFLIWGFWRHEDNPILYTVLEVQEEFMENPDTCSFKITISKVMDNDEVSVRREIFNAIWSTFERDHDEIRGQIKDRSLTQLKNAMFAFLKSYENVSESEFDGLNEKKQFQKLLAEVNIKIGGQLLEDRWEQAFYAINHGIRNPFSVEDLLTLFSEVLDNFYQLRDVIVDEKTSLITWNDIETKYKIRAMTEDVDRLKRTYDYCFKKRESIWTPILEICPYFVEHRFLHSSLVLRNFIEIIEKMGLFDGKKSFKLLDKKKFEDIFNSACLATITHDVGLYNPDFLGYFSPGVIRKYHGLFSARWILDKPADFDMMASRRELEDVALISRLHQSGIGLTITEDNRNNTMILMGVLIGLADECDIRPSRVEKDTVEARIEENLRFILTNILPDFRTSLDALRLSFRQDNKIKEANALKVFLKRIGEIKDIKDLEPETIRNIYLEISKFLIKKCKIKNLKISSGVSDASFTPFVKGDTISFERVSEDGQLEKELTEIQRHGIKSFQHCHTIDNIFQQDIHYKKHFSIEKTLIERKGNEIVISLLKSKDSSTDGIEFAKKSLLKEIKRCNQVIRELKKRDIDLQLTFKLGKVLDIKESD